MPAAKYYWRWRPDWLLYASLSGTVTHALDPDVQLLLGGDNGLRGYPLRYEAGTSRALFTVEQRVSPIGIRSGSCGSAPPLLPDVGRTWGTGVVGNSDLGMLSDVGFGLRLGNTRSGLGNVLHIDFAVPAQGRPRQRELPIPGADHAELLVGGCLRRLHSHKKPDANREIEHPPAELARAALVVGRQAGPAPSSVPLSSSRVLPTVTRKAIEAGPGSASRRVGPNSCHRVPRPWDAWLRAAPRRPRRSPPARCRGSGSSG